MILFPAMTASVAPVAGPVPVPASRKVSVSLDYAVLAHDASSEQEAEASPSPSGWLSPSERHFNPGNGFQSPTTAYFEQPSFCVPGTAPGAGVPYFAPIVGAPPQAFTSTSTMTEPQQPQQSCVQAMGWWAASPAAGGAGAQSVQPVMTIMPGAAQHAPVAVASWGLGGDAAVPTVGNGFAYRALTAAPAVPPAAVPVATAKPEPPVSQKASGLLAANQRGDTRWEGSAHTLRLPMQPQGSMTSGIHGQVPEAVYVDLSSLRDVMQC
jgi:hypothetical protein